jgi:aminobenzoyl-glutamate utilization protein A
MMQRVQDRGGSAAYFLIGCDIPAVHHAVDFDIDETALDHGVALFTNLAETVLAPR